MVDDDREHVGFSLGSIEPDVTAIPAAENPK